MNVTIKIPGNQLAVVNDLLTGRIPCLKHDGFLFVDLVEYFADGYSVNVKVISGGAKGTQDACLPYCDVVLFNEDGNEVDSTGSAREKLTGEYKFIDDEHVCHVVEN